MTDEEFTQTAERLGVDPHAQNARSQRLNKLPRKKLEEVAAPVDAAERLRLATEIAGLLIKDDEHSFIAWWLQLTEPQLAYVKLIRRARWHLQRSTLLAQ